MIFDADGHLRWALGAGGADWITPTVAQLVVDLVDWNLSPQQAVDRGRYLASGARGEITLEPNLYIGTRTWSEHCRTSATPSSANPQRRPAPR